MAGKTFILAMSFDTDFNSAVAKIIEGIHFVECVSPLEALTWTANPTQNTVVGINIRLLGHCLMRLSGGIQQDDIDDTLATVGALRMIKEVYDSKDLPPGMADDAWITPTGSHPSSRTREVSAGPYTEASKDEDERSRLAELESEWLSTSKATRVRLSAKIGSDASVIMVDSSDLLSLLNDSLNLGKRLRLEAAGFQTPRRGNGHGQV